MTACGWLAYQSNASGQEEVFHTPTHYAVDGRSPSTARGVPLWGLQGRELFYRSPTGAIFGVVAFHFLV